MPHVLDNPLTFTPVFREKLWGGQGLAKFFPQYTLPARCGEAWLLSDLAIAPTPLNHSQITETGAEITLQTLLKRYPEQLLGQHVFAQQQDNTFPLLIKFIDAQADLSLQVHPDNATAQRKYGTRGKTELWYFLAATPQAQIINGFAQSLSPKEYQTHLHNHTLPAQLNHQAVQTHDAFFIPAGRIHNIGKGLLFAEIQQSSNITYRIDDFDRQEPNGQCRPLHLQEAVEALSFKASNPDKIAYTDRPNQAIPLVQSPHFCVQKITCTHRILRACKARDSFIVYVCLSGQLAWENEHGQTPMTAGSCLLIAAQSAQGALVGEGVVLECFMP